LTTPAISVGIGPAQENPQPIMPPKVDPYATSRARAVDIALILLAILIIALVIFTAPRHHSSNPGVFTPPAAVKAPVMLASHADP